MRGSAPYRLVRVEMRHGTGQMHHCGCGLRLNFNEKRITTVTVKNAPSATGRRRERRPTENGAEEKKSSAKLQPDFGIWFNAKEPRRICYEVRDDANQSHDLVYLSSYINDARTAPSLAKFAKGKLRIGMERDCWEVYGINPTLVSVSSVLTIFPVLGIEWTFEHACLERIMGSADERLWISDCILDEDMGVFQAERSLLRVKGGGGFWSLSVHLAPQPWRIILRDTHTPILP